MKILFWITDFSNSVGEITHARLFASELSKVEIYFLLVNNETSYLKNKFKVLSLNEIYNIPEYHFDIIIFSEYTQLAFKDFDPELYNKFQNILYNYIIPERVPIVTFDTSNLVGSVIDLDRKIKNCPEFEKKVKQDFPDWGRMLKLLDINLPIYTILPCPPHFPEKKQPFKYYWKLPQCVINYEQKEKLKHKLGCSSQAKIIFMAISIWEYNTLKQSKKVMYFLLLEKLLINYLQKLNKEICLIIISPIPFYKSGKFEKIKLHHIYINSSYKVDYEEFEDIFTSCDLILTNNAIQITFMRALYVGIPGINIKSSIPVINDDKDKVKPLFKLSEYNKEIIDILEQIQSHTVDSINTVFQKEGFPFYNSNFSKLFRSIEIFDETNFINSLYELLYDEDIKKDFKFLHKNYLKSLKDCLSPVEIISSLEKKNENLILDNISF